jgi:hypothetical protein
VGKSVGVTAEPEIVAWNLSLEDRFAVIASDGVFEFITSQGVIDMILKYDNILEAAKHVVAEAYRLWLTYDDRTDDITIIILAFRNMKKQSNSTTTNNNNDNNNMKKKPELVRGMSLKGIGGGGGVGGGVGGGGVGGGADSLIESRPVRKVMSKAKRKEIAENWSNEDKIVIDFDSIENKKVS